MSGSEKPKVWIVLKSEDDYDYGTSTSVHRVFSEERLADECCRRQNEKSYSRIFYEVVEEEIESELELEYRPPGEIHGRVDWELLNKNKKR